MACLVRPGSKEAVLLGCLCPVFDNREMPDDGPFWINQSCLLHGEVRDY